MHPPEISGHLPSSEGQPPLVDPALVAWLDRTVPERPFGAFKTTEDHIEHAGARRVVNLLRSLSREQFGPRV